MKDTSKEWEKVLEAVVLKDSDKEDVTNLSIDELTLHKTEHWKQHIKISYKEPEKMAYSRRLGEFMDATLANMKRVQELERLIEYTQAEIDKIHKNAMEG